MQARLSIIAISVLCALSPLSAQETTKDIITAPGLEEKRYIGPLKDAYDRIDPLKDGWESEALSAEASSQLQELVDLLESPEDLNAEALKEIVAEKFSARPLRPGRVVPVFSQVGIEVLRKVGATPNSEKFEGPKGATKAFQSWLEQAGLGPKTGHEPHFKLKLYRIEPRGQGAATSRILCTVSSHHGIAHKQINAEWTCDWERSADQPPRLRNITVTNYEEVNAHGDARDHTPLLSDATKSILGSTKAYQDQFLHSTDNWRLRIPRDAGLDVVANHGLAIGDINGDNLEDLYVCQQGGIPNRLFLQNRDGTLTDFTAESNTGWLDYCASALIVDLDNDGDKDLVVSQDFRMLFLDNVDGKGRFELAFGMQTKAQTFSLSAVDVDLDGRLDIYSCGYNPSAAGQRSGAMGEPLPFHDANNGGPNILWRNVGDWEFVDVTKAVGLDVNNRRFSFCASWEDFDNDGDLDLYVANDYGRNCLYENDPQKNRPFFREISDRLGVQDTSAGMSTNWADFNRDGWMDLYVSNMFSGAGNRITYQRQFQTGTSQEVRSQFQRMARGNTLFQADGKGGFRDVSTEAGVTMGRWAWGSSFVDINNDGWQDLLVANGFITTDDTGDL